MERQALVVGINRYPFWKKSPQDKDGHLSNSHSDAEAVARLLELYGDFQVKRLPSRGRENISQIDEKGNLTTEELKKEITELFKPQKNIPKTALLYFAGRGLEGGFLATSNTNRRNNYGVSLQWLRELLLNSPVQQQIVWLDCGYSGELLNFQENEIISRDRDRFFITATKNSEPIYVRTNHGSVLTQAIVNSLIPNHQNEGKVTSLSMQNMIETQLANANLPQNPGFYITPSPIIITGIRGTQWYDIHRLERLWNETADWFAAEKEKVIMKHSSQPIINYFFGDFQDTEKARLYKNNIENVLGFRLPTEWWKNNKSIANLHESLKSLCGTTFCGNDDSLGDRTITIGSAYLIALIAYREVFKDVTKLTQGIDLAKMTNLDSQLLPIQEPEIAKLSAKSLYDLFYYLFIACQNGESGFENIFFDPLGHKFEIEFTRGGNEAKGDKKFSLAKDLYKVINDDNVPTPRQSINTKSAILRLWKYMLISNDGFMSPGVIYMERKTLVVASLI